eukprot:scaffold11123_cov68-Isochrysis_galbana.AAC.3
MLLTIDHHGAAQHYIGAPGRARRGLAPAELRWRMACRGTPGSGRRSGGDGRPQPTGWPLKG